MSLYDDPRILLRERRALEELKKCAAMLPASRLTGIGVRQHEKERLDRSHHLRFEPAAFSRQSDLYVLVRRQVPVRPGPALLSEVSLAAADCPGSGGDERADQH